VQTYFPLYGLDPGKVRQPLLADAPCCIAAVPLTFIQHSTASALQAHSLHCCSLCWASVCLQAHCCRLCAAKAEACSRPTCMTA
jgi:hypothetical protein